MTDMQIGRRLRLLRWLTGGAIGLAAIACTHQEMPPVSSPPSPSVTVTPVERVAIADSEEYVGRVESTSTVDLRARVSGFLERRTFEEGGDVTAGELLYLIEQEPYQAAVDSAEAAVVQTQAALRNAEAYLERLNAVKDAGGASKADLDTAQGAVQETRALLNQRRAQLVQAQLNLGYTEIRAPISGRIGRTAIHVGNLVGPGSGILATIVQLDPMWVTFPVSERDYLRMQERIGLAWSGSASIGQFVPTIRLVDGSIFPQPGRIDFQDNRIDEETGTIVLRATFPNPRLLLRPGQFVTVIQRRRETVDRLVIPQAAVQRDQVGPFVMVIDESNRTQIRRIQLGDAFAAKWIVTEGLKEGDLVISAGLQKVTEGAVVNPTRAQVDDQEGASGAE